MPALILYINNVVAFVGDLLVLIAIGEQFISVCINLIRSGFSSRGRR